MLNKLLFLGICLFGVQLAKAQYTDIINSNRPGESFSAFSVGKNVIQAETGFSYLNQKFTKYPDRKLNGYFIDLDLRYGLLKEELEIIAEFQYRNQNLSFPDMPSVTQNGFHTFNIGGKYLLYDPFKNYEEKVNIYSWKANQKFKWRQFLPAVSVYVGANLFFFNNPYKPDYESKVSPKIMALLQNHFYGGWVFVTNLYVDRIASKNTTYGWIFTTTKSINPQWSAFVEGQGYKAKKTSDFIVRGGVAYLMNSNIQLDVSVSKNIHDTRDLIYGGIGFSWRYDKLHQDEKYNKDGTKVEEDKPEKERKKKKRKKADEDQQEAPVSDAVKTIESTDSDDASEE
ncbi:MAG: transporter [Bacteroidota bacterium]|nr:transporter [Bacteroidota bacterium]